MFYICMYILVVKRHEEIRPASRFVVACCRPAFSTVRLDDSETNNPTLSGQLTVKTVRRPRPYNPLGPTTTLPARERERAREWVDNTEWVTLRVRIVCSRRCLLSRAHYPVQLLLRRLHPPFVWTALSRPCSKAVAFDCSDCRLGFGLV